MAAWHCQKADSQLQVAAADIASLLRHLCRNVLDWQARSSSTSPAAALMCSIANAHQRRPLQVRRQSGQAPSDLSQPKPISSLAEVSEKGKHGAADERILISEVTGMREALAVQSGKQATPAY